MKLVIARHPCLPGSAGTPDTSPQCPWLHLQGLPPFSCHPIHSLGFHSSAHFSPFLLALTTLTSHVSKTFYWNNSTCSILQSHSFFFLRFYLFIHEKQRERGRDTGRGRSRLHVGSPMWYSIPGFQDHALGQRQALNC